MRQHDPLKDEIHYKEEIGCLPGKREKVSFDAMVKFFIHHYGIPTRKDVEKLVLKIDNLEKLVKATAAKGSGGRGRRSGKGGVAETALDQVFNVIKKAKNGATFSDIQSKTGFEDKKIRNIIFRLNKLGKIARKRRGVYILAG